MHDEYGSVSCMFWIVIGFTTSSYSFLRLSVFFFSLVCIKQSFEPKVLHLSRLWWWCVCVFVRVCVRALVLVSLLVGYAMSLYSRSNGVVVVFVVPQCFFGFVWGEYSIIGTSSHCCWRGPGRVVVYRNTP